MPDRVKLTETRCRAAGYPYEVDDAKNAPRFVMWDAEVIGFGLRVQPSGRKSFVFRYTLAGRQRWMTLGDYPGSYKVEEARDKAREHKVAVSDKRDPKEEQRKREEELRRKQQGPTVADLADAYIEHARTRKRDPIKPSTVESYENYASHVNATFGRRLPRTISDEEVKRWYDGMADEPTGANRRLWFLSALMDDATARGFRKGTNPCKAAVKGKGGREKRYEETKRKRYLKADELARLGDALRDLEGRRKGVSAEAAGVIRWLLATGCRKSEALAARWEHIDMAEGKWHIPDAKGGPRDVLLNQSAMAVLATLPRAEGNPYLFPGQKPGRPLTTLQKPWSRLREAAGIPDVRLHDLRHTVGSWTVSTGSSLEAVAGVLGHAETSTSERYAHVQEDPIRKASERAGSAIFAALDGEHGGR